VGLVNGGEEAIIEHQEFDGESSQKQELPTTPTFTTGHVGTDSTTDVRQHNVDKLLKVGCFSDIFELVKLAVEQVYELHRAGLSLVLQGLPSNLGAYHVLGSNMIIVNKRILAFIKGIKTHEQYNSYLFTVLTHEYLHSFGITNEFRVRSMTYRICTSFLGEGHPATIMARYEPWLVFPELGSLQNTFDRDFEIVKEFDRKGQSYIS
jgi:hypothetical protein